MVLLMRVFSVCVCMVQCILFIINTSCECSTYTASTTHIILPRLCFFVGCLDEFEPMLSLGLSLKFTVKGKREKNALASAQFPFVLLILIDKMVLVIMKTHKHTHRHVYSWMYCWHQNFKHTQRYTYLCVYIRCMLCARSLCEIFIWHIIKFFLNINTLTLLIYMRRNFPLLLSCHVNIKHSTTWIVKYPKLKLLPCHHHVQQWQ